MKNNSTMESIRLECLKFTNGDFEKAKELYEWVTGIDKPKINTNECEKSSTEQPYVETYERAHLKAISEFIIALREQNKGVFSFRPISTACDLYILQSAEIYNDFEKNGDKGIKGNFPL